MSEVDWINIAVATASARVDDKEQAAAVCRYLRGEVERLAETLAHIKRVAPAGVVGWAERTTIRNSEVTHE